MKKLICLGFSLFCLFLITNQVQATSSYSHVITLEPGWNLVSPTRLLESHEFSASSTSANYDIYVLNPNSVSSWSTMAQLGQTEFQPLFGYFINNKTGTTTTLTFNYRQDVPPNDRLFSRTILPGWNSVGVANPSYALKQKDSDITDTNNVKNILDSISQNTQSVYDLTANQTPKYTTGISDVWSAFIYIDANNLDDFRETKAYVTYNTSTGTYNGFQNNDPIQEVSGETTLSIAKNNSFADQNIFASSTQAKIGSFILTAGTAEGVNINNIHISGFSSEQLLNLQLKHNNSILATQSTLPLSGTTTIDMNSNLNLSAGESKIIDIYAGITSTTSTFSLITSVDGVSEITNTPLTTLEAELQMITITGVGTITITKAADEVGVTDSRLVVAGVEDTIAKYKLTATNEPLRLNKIRVKITASSTATQDAALTEIADVSLWSGATQIAAATTPSSEGVYAVADFNTFLSNLDIPKDGIAYLTVKVNYKNTADGARSGRELTAFIDKDDNFEFRGIGTDTVISSVSADVAGNPVYIYKSIPTIVNGTLPTTVLSSGNMVLNRFSVTANAKGVIDWRTIKFTISTTTATASGFTLVDESNTSVGTCTLTAQTTVTCTSATDNQIAAGTTKTYSLKANVVATEDHGAISTYIARPSTTFANPDAHDDLSSASFIWSDEPTASHAASSEDYMGDFLVRNLPLDSLTLSK